MGAHKNAAPVIIKRKKIVAGGGHHGGAWKVAYADFVTAMMAFFLLMWLLNATTEKQRKGIADYFSPTIPLSRISGGGDGSFGGESVFSEDRIAQNGTGASSLKPTAERQAEGQTGVDASQTPEAAERFNTEAERIEAELQGLGGESMAMRNALRHITTRVTDEGLIVEIFDVPGEPLFEGDGASPMPVARDIVEIVVRVFALAENAVAVNGHVRARPEVLRLNPNWDLSSARADRIRAMMEEAGQNPHRSARVTGFADRKPAGADPADLRNNRIEIILLRTEERKGPSIGR
ncbi:MAG: flagellar motor protein MotB [Paracoccaceae bacterium]